MPKWERRFGRLVDAFPRGNARAANKPRADHRQLDRSAAALTDSGLRSDSCYVFLGYCPLVPDRCPIQDKVRVGEWPGQVALTFVWTFVELCVQEGVRVADRNPKQCESVGLVGSYSTLRSARIGMSVSTRVSREGQWFPGRTTSHVPLRRFSHAEGLRSVLAPLWCRG